MINILAILKGFGIEDFKQNCLIGDHMNIFKNAFFKIISGVFVCFLVCLIIFCIYLFREFINDSKDVNGHYHSYEHPSSININKSYYKTFKSGHIVSILFQKRDINVNSNNFKLLDEHDKQSLFETYPYYCLQFTVVDNGRLINFKDVIFEGSNAESYNDNMPELDFRSADVAYFKIGKDDVGETYLGKYPVKVSNILKITLNNTLFKYLIAQKKLKFNLIAHDNVVYTFEINNFLSMYKFETTGRN
ncbi:hypothetical protein CR532_04695 (plasmid) [Candidatus Borreliella tachyglossi]|uniref:Protein BptA n=2 Tax=Candidatus Borreliella tachyglossi TaxID=1964448 RepID=A0A2S1LYC9_9SPIR|nr:hypothetical protein CR532_04695 [Candidatus Borreliella tachyglossi]